MEQLSGFKLSHGEAVGIGIAIDTVYSEEIGYLDSTSVKRILNILQKLNF